MPLLDAPPMPPKKPNGMEITKAHGQEMTKKPKPDKIQSAKEAPEISKGGMIAKRMRYIRQPVCNNWQIS
jgi:hypothetical protein